jgi:tRNA nucleotidyltransferase (CCA-adding enzyme)
MSRATPEPVLAIARAVHDAGGRALLVGGCVRDELLGLWPKDYDLEVFGIEADRLRPLLARLGRVEAVGESFAVYKVGGVDVALPRRESKTGRGHKGFDITGDPSLSIEEAARRRDFTINAILRDPLTDEILDPAGGRADLDARRLRVVDPRTFGDDSLRVLRALQFVGRFELTVDPATAALCRQIPLDDLPPERIWGEMEKLLLQAQRPSLGFALALDLGVVDRLWPEMKALVGCPQEPEWHPEGDVWVHTLMVIDQARQRIEEKMTPREESDSGSAAARASGGGAPRAIEGRWLALSRGPALAIMLGAITHDFGKPATTAVIDGRIRSPGHEEAGVKPAAKFLDRLNVQSFDGFDVRGTVLGLVAHHLKPSAFRKAPTPVSDGAFRRLAQKVDLELLALLAKADCHGRTGHFDCSAMDWFLDRARALGVEHEAPRPLVLGRHLLDLGVAPGPEMGVMLKRIYEKQLDGEITTVEAGILEAAAMLKASPDR